MVDVQAYKQLKENKRLSQKEYKNYIVNRTILICFISLVLVHILDIISTIIGLSLGARETNPVTAYLFTFKFWGFILGSIYVISIFVVCFMIIEIGFIIYKKIVYQEAPLSLVCGVYIGFTMLNIIGIGLAIINNINVIFYFLS